MSTIEELGDVGVFEGVAVILDVEPEMTCSSIFSPEVIGFARCLSNW